MKQYLRYTLAILLATGMSIPLRAQTPRSDDLRTYRQLLSDGTYVSPLSGSPFSRYLEGYQLFLSTALHAGDSAIDAYFERMEELEDTLDESDPFFTYTEAEFKLQEAFIELKAGNELSAAWKLRQAYKLAENALDEPGANPALHKTMGVMQCLIGSIPEKMQWIPSLFGIDGSIDEGIEQLNTACRQAEWVCTEANLLLALSHSYLLNEDEAAIQYAADALHSPVNQPLPAYLLMNIYMRGHRTDSALLQFGHLSEKKRDAIPQLYYMAGNAYLQSGDFGAARENYLAYIESDGSPDFIRDSWYKTGLAWWLEGNEEKALSAMENVMLTGVNETEADRYATSHAQLPLPDPVILRIRFLTDGGFFQDARQLVQETDASRFTDPKVKTEYIYRSARLDHLTGDTTAALLGYAQVVDQQGDESWYYAPNSCLMSGYLLAGRDREKAAEWFRKVRDYRNYEYEKGIERQAQAALNHLD